MLCECCDNYDVVSGEDEDGCNGNVVMIVVMMMIMTMLVTVRIMTVMVGRLWL